MQQLRRSHERGYADHGWLKSYHSFSFADYFDPAHVQFGPLRVINEDRVQAGAGFGTHGHRDMEILSYVLSGSLAHKDSMGNGSTLQAGDVQRMSAGRGVQHSEYNASKSEPVHFVQIWIHPDQRGLQPGYEEKHFSAREKTGRLRLIASPDGADGSLHLHQDARVYATLLDAQDRVQQDVGSDRGVYIQALRGSVSANGIALQAGDALALTEIESVRLDQARDSELLLFDLPHSST